MTEEQRNDINNQQKVQPNNNDLEQKEQSQDTSHIINVPISTGIIKETAPSADAVLDQAMASGQNWGFFITTIIVAGIKDIIEIIAALIPIIDLLSWIFSVPLAIILILLLRQAGKKESFQFILSCLMQLIDTIPILSLLPLSTISVLVVFGTKSAINWFQMIGGTSIQPKSQEWLAQHKDLQKAHQKGRNAMAKNAKEKVISVGKKLITKI